MARRPVTSRSLRRAAAGPAPARARAANPRLVEAAHAGIITRSNTEPGTAGRSAADRVVYERRQRRAEARGLTARQAAGHAARGDVLPSTTAIVRNPDGSTQHREIEASRRDASRLGRYNNLVRQLAEGKISGPEFQRRVSRWRPLASGERLESRPEAALAAVEDARARGVEVFKYRSGRRGAPR